MQALMGMLHPTFAAPSVVALGLYGGAGCCGSWVEASVSAVALTSCMPIPIMAARAVLTTSTPRQLVGALGLAAWYQGWHSPLGRRSCQGLSLLVTCAGLGSGTWSSLVVVAATLRNPVYPADERVPRAESRRQRSPRTPTRDAGRTAAVSSQDVSRATPFHERFQLN